MKSIKATQSLDFSINVTNGLPLGNPDASDLINKLRFTADQLEAAHKQGYELFKDINITIIMTKVVDVDLTENTAEVTN